MLNPDRRRALVSTVGLAIGGLAMAQFLPEERDVENRLREEILRLSER
jgi:hypothetical protein